MMPRLPRPNHQTLLGLCLLVVLNVGCAVPPQEPPAGLKAPPVSADQTPPNLVGTLPLYVSSAIKQPGQRYGSDRHLTFENFRTYFARAWAHELHAQGYRAPISDLGCLTLSNLRQHIQSASDYQGRTVLFVHLDEVVASKWHNCWVTYQGRILLWRHNRLDLDLPLNMSVYSGPQPQDFFKALRAAIKYELPFWYRWDGKL